MHPAPPALLELALRLRFLRTDRWPDRKLTQSALAKALGKEVRLSPATVASWESKTAPKLPPREKVEAYAQFFATRRSIELEPTLLPLDSFTPQEHADYLTLHAELLRLHDAARGGGAPEAPFLARQSWHFADSGPLTLVCATFRQAASPSLIWATRTTRNCWVSAT